MGTKPQCELIQFPLGALTREFISRLQRYPIPLFLLRKEEVSDFSETLRIIALKQHHYCFSRRLNCNQVYELSDRKQCLTLKSSDSSRTLCLRKSKDDLKTEQSFPTFSH